MEKVRTVSSLRLEACRYQNLNPQPIERHPCSTINLLSCIDMIEIYHDKNIIYMIIQGGAMKRVRVTR